MSSKKLIIKARRRFGNSRSLQQGFMCHVGGHRHIHEYRVEEEILKTKRSPCELFWKKDYWQTWDPPASVYWVAVMTGVNHCAQFLAPCVTVWPSWLHLDTDNFHHFPQGYKLLWRNDLGQGWFSLQGGDLSWGIYSRHISRSCCIQ